MFWLLAIRDTTQIFQITMEEGSEREEENKKRTTQPAALISIFWLMM